MGHLVVTQVNYRVPTLFVDQTVPSAGRRRRLTTGWAAMTAALTRPISRTAAKRPPDKPAD